MHDGMPYGRNQGQGQGHSREVDRQSPTGLIFIISSVGRGTGIRGLMRGMATLPQGKPGAISGQRQSWKTPI